MLSTEKAQIVQYRGYIAHTSEPGTLSRRLAACGVSPIMTVFESQMGLVKAFSSAHYVFTSIKLNHPHSL